MEVFEKEYNLCLNENIERKLETHTDTLCIRCVRKKYKCLLIWLLSIASISQLLYLILDKIDSNIIEDMFKKFLQNNSTKI
jgi:hypothetical protein